MATYREFYEETRRRRRKRTMQRLLAFVVTAAVILALAWVIVKIIGPEEPEVGGLPADPVAADQNTASSGSESQSASSDAQSAAQGSVLAPLPMQDLDTPPDQSWNTVGPVEQTLDYTITAPDHRLLSLPANGVVDLSYFDTVAFLGDSISQSFAVYTPEVHGTKVAAIGAGPKNVVDGTAMPLERNGAAVNMLDTVVNSQPDNVYILLGTNTLVNPGNDDQFLAYYGKMLDMLKERLDPRVGIYVQAITPVRPEVVQQKAGLENNRLRAINSRLAALALEKGCYFLDLQEVFVDAEGNMREDFAAPDGIHLNKQGTQAWVEYLCSHTAYNKRNPYLYGSPYYIEGE